MKIKVAYKIARLAREIQKEIELFESTRHTLIEKYGIKNENGELVEDKNGGYPIQKEKKNEFLKETNELLNSKISLNVDKLSLKDLEEAELTPQQIIKLIDFIEEVKE
jgi:acyl-CoA synthetase (NDP forming)